MLAAHYTQVSGSTSIPDGPAITIPQQTRGLAAVAPRDRTFHLCNHRPLS